MNHIKLFEKNIFHMITSNNRFYEDITYILFLCYTI